MVRADLPSHVDPAWNDPELERAVRALCDGDPTPAFDLLAATREQPDRRELCVTILGQAGSAVLPLLRAAAEEQRDDVERLLLWGSALDAAAWQARGAAFAEHTTDEQFGQLVDLTKQARAVLRRAAKLAPDDAVPWSELMHGALGAPEHDDEGDEVFAQVGRRSPDLYGANYTRLQSLAAKWYGSHETMLEFARSRTADLPPGHPLLALIAVAHVEVHIHNLDNGNFFKRLWKGMTYLGKAPVRAEVDAASDRLLAGVDVFGGHPRWLAANQVFATFYHQLGDDMASKPSDTMRLARHLAYSGERPALWPWGYFGDHEEQFAKARNAVAGTGMGIG
ncbi:hypothetical protein [Saccharothrix deserti]|uniref:hypothetical protein n=1 Tax=Saccharothrix deserti TaxID=2593674 RepID=UPI00131B3EDF|nr:hypothetical protein [Saccharothrix deserti]